MNKKLADLLQELEHRHLQEIQLGLTRCQEVGTVLNLLTHNATVITVAGTNGKGSTVAVLETIYCRAGYHVGTFTSPHLLHFNERIKINQEPISDEHLYKALMIIEQSRNRVPLTYFETITLAALWYFKQFHLDLIILEVGLGGRLDATNIVDNDLAIITGIDFDHQAYLGNTLEEIGHEKAGILRANKPCIYADDSPPASVLKQATLCQSIVYRKGVDYDYQINKDYVTFHYNAHQLQLPRLPLHPNSITAAVMATFCLQDKLPITMPQILIAIKNTILPGRLQVIMQNGISTVLDVSHNPQSVAYLLKFLQEHWPHAQVHAVFSALSDKDIAHMIKLLSIKVNFWYPTLVNSKRSLSAEELLKTLNTDEQRTTLCHNTPLAAYQAACANAQSGDVIIVCGSFITVAAVLGYSFSHEAKVRLNSTRRAHEISNG